MLDWLSKDKKINVGQVPVRKPLKEGNYVVTHFVMVAVFRAL